MIVIKVINEKDFRVIVRDEKIILSAPHAVKQFRNGKIKPRETKTKYIVEKVSSFTKSSCIYKTKYLKDDVNYDEYSYYKEKCRDIVKLNGIKVLLDVHGMSPKREEDICIGTCFGRNIFNRLDILEDIKNIFILHGFKNVSIDKPFSASSDNTVSSYIHNTCDILTFQIEINFKYMSKKFIECDLDRVLNSIENIVKYLNNILNNLKI